ncbi:sigma-70 family RNA polymerase sigma factor [Brachyspira sp.]|uniref:sigma-70 family RNA polymerase sigma factor n=1 Tax=Brachyspira sp. TaxID=1977261 RepID=UPI003D7D64FB
MQNNNTNKIIITDENEKEYLDEFKKTLSPQIKAALVKKYAPLVKHVANKMLAKIPETTIMDYGDLVSAGFFGLLCAIDRYDTNKDIKFKPYAINLILGCIYDELRLTGVDTIEEIKKTVKFIRENMRAKETIKIIKWKGIMKYILHANMISTSSNEFSRYIDDRINPEYLLEKKEFKKEFINILKKLPKQEFDVLKLYYYEGLILKEIGKKLEISEIKVSKIH